MSEDTDLPDQATAKDAGDKKAYDAPEEPKAKMGCLLTVFIALVVLAGGLFIRYRDRLMDDLERWQSLNHYELGPPAPPDIQILREGDKTLLWGTHDGHHFDITEFRLDSTRLTHGSGRDFFPPRLDPEFVNVEQANAVLDPGVFTLVVKVGDEVKIYPSPYDHVINDVVGGTPIALLDSYVIERQYGDVTLTFSNSGYMEVGDEDEAGEARVAELTWDLETESLWSPLAGKAVAGPCLDIPLKILDESQWGQFTWEDATAQFPDAMVMDPDFEPGESFDVKTQSDPPWPDKDPPDVERLAADDLGTAAPQWGENAGIPQGESTSPEAR